MSIPRKRRNWARDQDYLSKLTEEQILWLLKFNKEYYEGRFGEDAIHPPEFKKECGKRRNAMESDAMRAALPLIADEPTKE